MRSRLGCFLLGFGTGALTVAAFRRLRKIVEEVDYDKFSDSMQDRLEQLEARLNGAHESAKPRARRT